MNSILVTVPQLSEQLLDLCMIIPPLINPACSLSLILHSKDLQNVFSRNRQDLYSSIATIWQIFVIGVFWLFFPFFHISSFRLLNLSGNPYFLFFIVFRTWLHNQFRLHDETVMSIMKNNQSYRLGIRGFECL